MKILRLLVMSTVLVFWGGKFAQSSFQTLRPKLTLNDGWSLQSLQGVRNGEGNCQPRRSSQGLDTATVPTTVVAAQVKRGLLPDPHYE